MWEINWLSGTLKEWCLPTMHFYWWQQLPLLILIQLLEHWLTHKLYGMLSFHSSFYLLLYLYWGDSRLLQQNSSFFYSQINLRKHCLYNLAARKETIFILLKFRFFIFASSNCLLCSISLWFGWLTLSFELVYCYLLGCFESLSGYKDGGMKWVPIENALFI